MLTKVVLPLLAVIGLSFAIYTVVQARQPGQPSEPLMEPPRAPRAYTAIAGAGIIEARMENVPVGTAVAGLVTDVFVPIFELPVKVKAGDPLFQIDDRQARAEVKVREAMLASAEAEYRMLEAAPREEDVPPLEAAVGESQAALEEAEARSRDEDLNFDRIARLRSQNAVTASEYDRARQSQLAAKAAAAKARASHQKALADLAKLKDGTWDQQLLVAKAKVIEAQSQLDAAKTELERLTVRALTEGEVLQVNVRPGQFAALAWKEPLVVIGDLKKLHVRVDIDEQDLPHFRAGAEAMATLKGRPGVRFPLQFVKVEPYVIPKRSLTGENSERVDTRVLQVLYALPDERPIDLYVGLQMDVYIQKTPPPEGVDLDAGPSQAKPFEDRGPIPETRGKRAPSGTPRAA